MVNFNDKLMEYRVGRGYKMPTGLEKPVTHRNNEYIKFIRMQPCIACGAPAPSAAHHCRRIDPGRPSQSRVSDYNCLPFCVVCHDFEHRSQGLDILELYQSAFHLLRTYIEGLYE